MAQMVHGDVPGTGHGLLKMVTPAMRTTAVLLGFQMTNMPCSDLP